MIGTLASFGIEALSKVRTNRKTLADMNVGLLFGINSDGKAIPADSSTGVRAVGIANCGTEYAYGVAREFNKTDKVNAGKEVNAEQFGIINVAADSFTQLQIGAPIYLSTAGSFSLTAPTVVGHLSQKVGKVYSRASVQIDLTQDAGTAVANNIAFYSANGAITPSGYALIAGGTGIAGLTLGAPTPGVYLEIRIDSLSSGNVVVTTGTGITLNSTGNNTATFNAAGEALRLGYFSATRWQIIENVNAVALSTV
jgi:hypothetical protein